MEVQEVDRLVGTGVEGAKAFDALATGGVLVELAMCDKHLCLARYVSLLQLAATGGCEVLAEDTAGKEWKVLPEVLGSGELVSEGMIWSSGL